MKIAYGLLAAGESKRFGKFKQMEDFSGLKLIEIAIKALSENNDLPIVVTGKSSEKIASEYEVQFLHNPNYKQGMGTSIAVLASHASSLNYDALLIHLCDLPLVTRKDINNLVEKFLKDPSTPLTSHFRDTTGPPCIFPKSLFNELSQLTGKHGAKSVLKNHASRTMDLPSAQYDIDTPSDLDRFKSIDFKNNYN